MRRLKKYNHALVVAIYGISYALVPLGLGFFLASAHINLDVSGDFWAAIAGVMFLSNVFGLGSERLVMIYAQRFKYLYFNSLKINLINVLKFFLLLFVIIGLITAVIDLIIYLLLLNQIDLLPPGAHHPILLCCFCIFFFMTARFLAAFLQGEGFQLCVMRYSIYTNIVRVISVYWIIHNSFYFETLIGGEYNFVFTLCLALSLAEVIRIIGYSVKIFNHLRAIPNSKNNQLDMGWKHQLYYFALYSLQYDWLVVVTILVEMFGVSELEPAIMGYLIGIIRIFYLLGYIAQQLTRIKITQLTVRKADLLKYWRITSKNMISILVVTLLVTFVISHPLLVHYGIPEYLPQLLILIVIGACKAYSEAILVNVIFTTNSTTIRWFVYISSLIYFAFISAVIIVAPVGIHRVLNYFILFYGLIACFELVYGSIVLRRIIRTHQNYTLQAI